MVSILGGGKVSVPRLAGLFRSLIRSGPLHGGRIDVARRDGDGAILGAALWEEPYSRTNIANQVGELPSFLRVLGWRGIISAARHQSVLASYRPAEPHWYLAEIGVGAEARGAGVGSALLGTRLEQIDREGMPAYLESSNERNRKLYERNGFTRTAVIRGIPNAAPVSMWRVPRG